MRATALFECEGLPAPQQAARHPAFDAIFGLHLHPARALGLGAQEVTIANLADDFELGSRAAADIGPCFGDNIRAAGPPIGKPNDLVFE